MIAWGALAIALAVQQGAADRPLAERLVAVRVHGNHTTPDAEVIALTGLTVGGPLDAAAPAQAVQRLRASGRFDGVEVRKRYASLTDPTAVVLVFIVDEKPPPDVAMPGPLRPLGRLRQALMVLPILDYEDGYGLSYGGRFSFVEPFGPRSRITVPLTWGAWRRAAIEGDKRFTRGPISRAAAGAAVGRREHPFYDRHDRRFELWGRVERALVPSLRAGGELRWSDISFGPGDVAEGDPDGQRLDDRLMTIGADLVLDTRQDPTFPRNAVYARAAWERLRFDRPVVLPAAPAAASSASAAQAAVPDAAADRTVNRYTLEGRGYVGVAGSSVLSVRVLHGWSDRPLPPYEQWLLGGASNLRGFRAGTAVGDRLMAVSTELRLPVTSPLNVGRAGFMVFADTGVVYPDGARLRDQEWQRGFGGGVFVAATVFQLQIAVARGVGGATRVHVTGGASF
ncbi:MAG TPA: BamA/TamA family outer membrane protein [Vicinamibacterales bacterium]